MMADFDITETLSFPCPTPKLTSHGVPSNPITNSPVIFNPFPEHYRPWAKSWFNVMLGFIHLPYDETDINNKEQFMLNLHESGGHGSGLLKYTPAKQFMRRLAWDLYTEIYHLALGDLGVTHLPQMENMPNMHTYPLILQKIYNVIAPVEELLAIYCGILEVRFTLSQSNPFPDDFISDKHIQDTIDHYIRNWYWSYKNFPNVSTIIPSPKEALSFYFDLEDLLNKLIYPDVFYTEGLPDLQISILDIIKLLKEPGLRKYKKLSAEQKQAAKDWKEMKAERAKEVEGVDIKLFDLIEGIIVSGKGIEAIDG
jgi:hypothetical protein